MAAHRRAQLLLVLVGCAQRVDVLPGYTRASASEHASLLRAVSDYYTLRARAFVLGDASVLTAAYPKLAEGANLQEGVTIKAQLAAAYAKLGARGGAT